MRDERGVALIIVIIVSMLLTLLGLSISFSSMTELTINNDLEKKKKAAMIADAGYNVHRDLLRGNDISTILQSTTAVAQYINYTEPAAGTVPYNYFSRNPLAPIEAINVNFDSPPSPITTRSVNGLLTPAGGASLLDGGRYWVKITDNDDGDGDLTTDVDGTIYLRVLGIQKSGPGQVSTYGGTVKNSMAIIEATLKRDMTLDFRAPLSLYGEEAEPAQGANLFAGNAFSIDGYEHDTMTLADLIADNHSHTTGGDTAGIDAIYDNLGGGDATELRTSIYDDLNSGQKDNIVGDTSDYSGGGEPSIRDATDSIRNDSNQDATNIFNASYVMNIIKSMATVADIKIPDQTNYGGNDIGSDADPKLTYCEGDCTLGGSTSGAGLLIVRGRLDFDGGFSYRGLILVVGDGEFKMSGEVGILGGIFVADIDDNGDGTYSYDDEPQITISGDSKLYYSASGIQMGYSLLPMKSISVREINPEIEPPY